MWRTLFDSVSGTSHVASGLPCQDACRVLSIPTAEGEVLVTACADGAGSASHSDVGSRLACDSLITFAQQHVAQAGAETVISRATLDDWYLAARQRIIDESLSIGVAPRELACTLLFAFAGPRGATFSQIGDGAIVLRSAGQFDYAPVFWPQSGEYANTTNFLTTDALLDKLCFSTTEVRVDDLAMFSDGLERLILRFADQSVHGPFLDPLFAQLRATDNVDALFAALRQFLDSPLLNERTDDDKTLILASCV